jgi:hypothetical protein
MSAPQGPHASNGGAAPLRAGRQRRIRITQLDGKLPNLALMKLSHWHQAQGDDVTFRRHAGRDLYEEPYDVVYGSAIFTRSLPLVQSLQRDFPGAIVGGPGTLDYGQEYQPETFATVERTLGLGDAGSYEHYDYGIYPDFQASIGYTQRGCRFSCGFCPVWRMEGRVHAVASIMQVWRGDPYPRHLHLLDNDFFGQPNWKSIVDAMVEHDFKVCLNQGINVRVLTPAVASYVARLPYYDDAFKDRRLYTAWDNVGDEAAFERGMKLLFDNGILPDHVMVYMLVGYDDDETVERVFYRFNKMRDMGVRVYPMPYNEQHVKTYRDGSVMDLKKFQRWVVSAAHKNFAWRDYRVISQSERLRQHRLRREAKYQIPLLPTPASITFDDGVTVDEPSSNTA